MIHFALLSAETYRQARPFDVVSGGGGNGAYAGIEAWRTCGAPCIQKNLDGLLELGVIEGALPAAASEPMVVPTPLLRTPCAII